MTARVEPSPTDLVVMAARQDLGVFIPLVQTITKGPSKGQRAWPQPHHETFINALQDDGLGHTLIVAPPGSAKTETVLSACAWWVGRDPGTHIGYFSNVYAQSEARSLAVREVLEQNERYRAVFPEVQRGDRMWTAQMWAVERARGDKDPTFFAAAPGTGLGWRLERLILDDIADEENMATETQRQRIVNWLNTTAMSRLTPDGRAVMICTRWHEMDPAAWALEDGWHVVHVPAFSDTFDSYWPAEWPVERLERERRRMGSYRFELMYQGRVASEEAGRIRRSWFQFYDAVPANCTIIQSWDTAYSDREEAAYSVGLTWGIAGGDYYLLDVYRGRPLFPDLKRAVIGLAGRWRPVAILVEEMASGRSVIQELRSETALPLIGIKVWKSKEGRMSGVDAMAPMIEAGRVFLPSDAFRKANHLYWVDPYIHELCSVPSNQYWDQVDASTLFFNWARDRRSVRPEMTLTMGV